MIGTNMDDGEWDGDMESVSIQFFRENVVKLLDIVKEYSDRFPSLSNVGVRPAWAAVSFDTHHSRSWTGLIDLALSDRSVGLKFVDDQDMVWEKSGTRKCGRR